MMEGIGRSSEKPAVAVVGAGLAGLSAAYVLCDRAHVTLFERQARIGGRILTSQRPWGEHGTEFFLSRANEPTINKLIKELGLKLISWDDWPGYLFRGQFACGSPLRAVTKLLAPESSRRVKRLFKRAKEEAWGKPRGKFDQWLSQLLDDDREAIAFVDMLLAGETCAPADHITARYGLEFLSSLHDDWHSIRGGAQKLVEALYENSGARLVLNAHASEVETIRGGVRVNWIEGRKRKSAKFQAVIVATPDGERLVGEAVRRHFHSYVSVLLEYEYPPRLKINPDFDLSRGLYTDGPINYVQTTKHKGSYVLRILIPDAKGMLKLDEWAVVDFCAQHFGQLTTGADQVRDFSIMKWKYGLPCGGDDKDKGFQRIGRRIVLAGDRFGKWPSMDTAIESGRRCAVALVKLTP